MLLFIVQIYFHWHGIDYLRFDSDYHFALLFVNCRENFEAEHCGVHMGTTALMCILENISNTIHNRMFAKTEEALLVMNDLIKS